ncbi:hypothetical protein C7M52_03852 [Mixta theicola]|nr:hypothetical protein C7M52_03852 [Mixta theicola]
MTIVIGTIPCVSIIQRKDKPARCRTNEKYNRGLI